MKKISLLLAAVMLLAVTAACGAKNIEVDNKYGAAPSAVPSATTAASPNTEAKGKLADIKRAGKIVLGTSANYAPYEFHKNIDGNDIIAGFDIEIAKAIAADIGVKLEIKDMGFDGLLAALDSGAVDFVMAGMTPNEERKKSVDFSQIYYIADQAILIRADDKDKAKTLDDFKKLGIGVQIGSIQEELAKKQLPGAKIKSIGKITDLVQELKNKKVDALIMELPVANGFVKSHPGLSISTVKLTNEEGGSAVAMKKGNPELVTQVDKTLSRLMKAKAVDQFVSEAVLLNEK